MVWADTQLGGDFLAIYGLLDRALKVSNFLDLSASARAHLLKTIDEIRSEFEVSKLLTQAPTIWQSRSIVYPLWARIIRQAIEIEELKPSQTDELDIIESDVQRLQFNCDKSEDIEPDARVAIREITELLTEAIESVRCNGLAEFTLERPFLFGKIRLILTRGGTDFGDLKADLKDVVKKLFVFANAANTAADIYEKLLN
jgi:hypothetical protein